MSMNNSIQQYCPSFYYFNLDEPHLNDLMWHNLIYIKLEFNIQNYTFKDEFLYDRKRASYLQIKQFAIELLKEQILDNTGNGYKNGINSITYSYLDYLSDFVTNKIKKEIDFYNNFHPFKLLSFGVFGNGMGIEKEFLIPISIDVDINDNESFHDEMMWDILNEKNM